VNESSSILTFLKHIIRKTGAFFKKSLSKEVLVFLIFFLISCFFWVLQSLQEVSEVEMKIPVSYSEIPDQISITNKLPKTITITLRDKGTNLYDYYRHRKDLTIPIDLLKWYRKDGISRIPTSTFESLLRNKLRSTTQLLRIEPDSIAVYFVEKAKKEVPVHLNSRLTLSVQHLLTDNPTVYPPRIKVYAPATVLKNLNSVETELLELEDMGDSTIVSIKLVPINGVRFSTNTVEVHLHVEEFTEQSLMIPVTGLNFPVGEELLSFPSNVKITFFVGLSNYAKISLKDFQISVDRSNLMLSDKSAQKVILVKSPKTVRNIRLQPETVDCLIEKK